MVREETGHVRDEKKTAYNWLQIGVKQDRILCTGTYTVRTQKQTPTLVLFSGEARCPLRILGHSSVTYHCMIFWLVCGVLQLQLEVTVSFLSKTTNSYPRTHSDTILSTPVLLNLITVQQDTTYSVYYISVGSSTCFGC